MMISASLATCLVCWAGSTDGKAVGMAADVDLVLWVEEGLLTVANEWKDEDCVISG